MVETEDVLCQGNLRHASAEQRDRSEQRCTYGYAGQLPEEEGAHQARCPRVVVERHAHEPGHSCASRPPAHGERNVSVHHAEDHRLQPPQFRLSPVNECAPGSHGEGQLREPEGCGGLDALRSHALRPPRRFAPRAEALGQPGVAPDSHVTSQLVPTSQVHEKPAVKGPPREETGPPQRRAVGRGSGPGAGSHGDRERKLRHSLVQVSNHGWARKNRGDLTRVLPRGRRGSSPQLSS